MTAFSWYLAWVLLPLVPAILLYLIFPKSQASIETPEALKPIDGKSESLLQKFTKGFVIKLGGAVAVYFLVFYLINPLKNRWYEKSNHIWDLQTSFKDESGNPVPFSRLQEFEIIPTNVNFEELDANSTLIRLAGVQENGDKVDIPYSIRVKFNGYESFVIPLRDSIDNKSFCEKLKEKKKFNLSTRILKVKLEKENSVQPNVETISEKIIN